MSDEAPKRHLDDLDSPSAAKRPRVEVEGDKSSDVEGHAAEEDSDIKYLEEEDINCFVKYGSRIVCASNLPFTTKDFEVKNLFKTKGEVLGIKFSFGQGGIFDRCCYVEMGSQQQALAAVELNGHTLRHLPIQVSKLDGEDCGPTADVISEDYGVYVEGLDTSMTEYEAWELLETLFRDCGVYSTMNISRKFSDDGKCIGIGSHGIVLFQTKEGQERSVKLSNSTVGNSKLTIEPVDDVDADQSDEEVA